MRHLLLPLLLSIVLPHLATAQVGEDRLKEVMTAAKSNADSAKWVTGGGIGADFTSLSLFNPVVGSGSNRIGFGVLTTFFADRTTKTYTWTNLLNVQLAVQRIGGRDNSFEKNLDALRYITRVGKSTKNERIDVAFDGDIRTSLLPTFDGNLLRDEGGSLLSKFFAPVTIQAGLGIDYKANDHLTLFFSPASVKWIYVGNDEIAALEVQGNKPGSRSRLDVGANTKLLYKDALFGDRLSIISALGLFANYLEDPGNIDITWDNTIDLAITPNLALSLTAETRYDDNINVIVRDNGDGMVTDDELAPSPSSTLAFLVKYNYIFNQ